MATVDLDFSGIPDLCRRYGVAQLDLFGSATGDDFDPERSDLDFLVAFDRTGNSPALRTYLGFRDSLMEMFGRSVDLVEIGTVRNPYRLAAMERQRRRIYPAP